MEKATTTTSTRFPNGSNDGRGPIYGLDPNDIKTLMKGSETNLTGYRCCRDPEIVEKNEFYLRNVATSCLIKGDSKSNLEIPRATAEVFIQGIERVE